MLNIDTFKGSRGITSPISRLNEVKKRAILFREEMLKMPQVEYYQSFPLIRVPYPTRFGLAHACKAFSPYLHILNRLFIVQFKQSGTLKTLLISPSDTQANKETPFFKKLSNSLGPFKKILEPIIAPQIDTVENVLLQVGIAPEDVDYISYDHLHTQDLRKWLGTKKSPAFFPNAKLLVTKQEWESANGLLPLLNQQNWYCPHGLEGVDSSRVIVLEEDTMVGDGVAIMKTPGHTEGNHSFVVHTPQGLLVTSENGIGPDAYSPKHSSLPGVKAYAQKYDIEVLMNSNTLERSLDQYISMIQEKVVAGPHPNNPNFTNVVSSSELCSHWAFLGIRPTFQIGELKFGRPQVKK